MEPPESVVQDLKAIRDTLELRWNPKGKVLHPGGYDAEGRLREPVYDPRWELWEKPDGFPEYKVLTLQYPDGSFRPAGQWLPEFMRLFNPARYDGDCNRMLDELVWQKEALQEVIADEEADDFFEMVAKWADWVRKPKQMVLTDLSPA